MDLGAVPSTSTTLVSGVNQLSTFAKGINFARLRNCRPLGSKPRDIRSKKVNANDNFANDNLEFAPATRVAFA